MATQTMQAPGMQLPDLQNKIAVITGAGSGIGRAAALALARQGVKVALLDLKDERREQVKTELLGMKADAMTVDVDVSDPQRMEAAYESVMKQWGRVDIVFANAGINGVITPIELMKPEDWDHTMFVNLKGTFLSVKFAIPHLKESGGSIIITSSINGSRTFSNIGMSAYATSKAGQVAFAKMAALELAKFKIRVNVICPGAITTNINENTHSTPELSQVKIPIQFPEGDKPLEHEAGRPGQVGELVSFLASEASSHITGTELYIDGAESLLR